MYNLTISCCEIDSFLMIKTPIVIMIGGGSGNSKCDASNLILKIE